MQQYLEKRVEHLFTMFDILDGEDIFTRHRLANVRWQTTYLYTAPERDGSSLGWSLVEEMSKLSDEVQQVDNTLNSAELKGADYEDFSNQEDKLKVCYFYKAFSDDNLNKKTGGGLPILK
jgi:hypothetical protein